MTVLLTVAAILIWLFVIYPPTNPCAKPAVALGVTFAIFLVGFIAYGLTGA